MKTAVIYAMKKMLEPSIPGQRDRFVFFTQNVDVEVRITLKFFQIVYPDGNKEEYFYHSSLWLDPSLRGNVEHRSFRKKVVKHIPPEALCLWILGP